MGFHEIRFPDDISRGSRGGPGFSTNLSRKKSGQIDSVSRWEEALYAFDVSYGTHSLDQLSAVLTFFHARQGSANGFRYKDGVDYSTATNGRDAPTKDDAEAINTTTGTDGDGDGSTTTFQLTKEYVSGSTTRRRTLTKPVAGTTKVAIDGILQSSGYTVDTTTGIITFSTAPGPTENVTAGCEFDVPVRFAPEVDAGLLASWDFPDGGAFPDSIMLIEDRDLDVQVEEAWYPGGATKQVFSATLKLNASMGTFITLAPTAALSVVMPEKVAYPLGAIIMVLWNDSAHVVTVLDDDGATTLWTMAADEKVMVGHADDGSSGSDWIGWS